MKKTMIALPALLTGIIVGAALPVVAADRNADVLLLAMGRQAPEEQQNPNEAGTMTDQDDADVLGTETSTGTIDGVDPVAPAVDPAADTTTDEDDVDTDATKPVIDDTNGSTGTGDATDTGTGTSGTLNDTGTGTGTSGSTNP